MRKNILFITSEYRTGEKVYPILPHLSKYHSVDILNLFRMSQETKWETDIDPRQKFYRMCDDLGLDVMHGPGVGENREINTAIYDEYVSNDNLKKILGDNRYNLVILDNNTHVKGMGAGRLYQWFSEQGVPYIGSPHGNKDYQKYKVLQRFGKLYDYSFVFGEKEKRHLNKVDKKHNCHLDKLLPAGIPSNDKLKEYSRNNEHILIIPNFTTQQHGITGNQKPFTIKTFEELELPKLSEEYNCPIVIKEKFKMFYEDDTLRKSLKKYKSIVEFVMVCDDDNALIANSVCVISAPSTLSFKSIQLGIPTVILKGQGMMGNFSDFPGVINIRCDEMKRTLEFQKINGRLIDFISDTLSGGVEYNSTHIYIDYINKVLRGEI